MVNDWGRLEGNEAWERIFRSALGCRAKELHISSDAEGATIFFVSCEQIDFFTHIPPDCRSQIRDYLRDVAGLDHWQHPPLTGFGVFVWEETTFNLEIRFLKGTSEEDIMIKISSD